MLEPRDLTYMCHEYAINIPWYTNRNPQNGIEVVKSQRCIRARTRQQLQLVGIPYFSLRPVNTLVGPFASVPSGQEGRSHNRLWKVKAHNCKERLETHESGETHTPSQTQSVGRWGTRLWVFPIGSVWLVLQAPSTETNGHALPSLPGASLLACNVLPTHARSQSPHTRCVHYHLHMVNSSEDWQWPNELEFVIEQRTPAY